jgi:hypothetical protein
MSTTMPLTMPLTAALVAFNTFPQEPGRGNDRSSICGRAIKRAGQGVPKPIVISFYLGLLATMSNASFISSLALTVPPPAEICFIL